MTSTQLIIIPAKAEKTATVIAVHGLGGEAGEWVDRSLLDSTFRDNFPHVKWVLPNAPLRRITVHDGLEQQAWYDVATFDLANDPNHKEDEAGMLETVRFLDGLIQEEVDSGTPASRIVLMGFSQGAAMTLLTALTGGKTRGRPDDDGWKLAGIAPLSGRVPLKPTFTTLASSRTSEIPIFWGHGDRDEVVKYAYGRACADMLVEEMSVRRLQREELGSPGLCFVTYKGLEHSINNAGLADLKEFLRKVIPATVP